MEEPRLGARKHNTCPTCHCWLYTFEQVTYLVYRVESLVVHRDEGLCVYILTAVPR